MFDTFAFLFGITSPALPLPLPTVAPLASISAAAPQPQVQALSALVMDADSGDILYAKDIYTPRPIASLTKLITTQVALERYAPDEHITVSPTASSQIPAKIYLPAGETLRAEDAIAASVIRSANDAAEALGEHAPGGIPTFIGWMNEYAAQLGLTATHYSTPVGLDDPGNYSTAYDLSLISRSFLHHPTLAHLASQSKGSITSLTGKKYNFVSTNELFGSYLDIRGLKTGSTDDAGGCIVALAHLPTHRTMLAIVLHSPDRFQEAKVLLEWASEYVK